MAPTVRSQLNRASLGCGGTGASCPGCASHKSPSTARCYPINILWHWKPAACVRQHGLIGVLGNSLRKHHTISEEAEAWALLDIPTGQ